MICLTCSIRHVCQTTNYDRRFQEVNPILKGASACMVVNGISGIISVLDESLEILVIWLYDPPIFPGDLNFVHPDFRFTSVIVSS